MQSGKNYRKETKMTNNDYKKLLEDIEDRMMTASNHMDLDIACRIRDVLKELIVKDTASSFMQGDILSNGVGTVTLLKYEPAYRIWVAYSVLRSDVIVLPFEQLVDYHKVGHMEPIKLVIKGES